MFDHYGNGSRGFGLCFLHVSSSHKLIRNSSPNSSSVGLSIANEVFPYLWLRRWSTCVEYMNLTPRPLSWRFYASFHQFMTKVQSLRLQFSIMEPKARFPHNLTLESSSLMFLVKVNLIKWLCNSVKNSVTVLLYWVLDVCSDSLSWPWLLRIHLPSERISQSENLLSFYIQNWIEHLLELSTLKQAFKEETRSCITFYIKPLTPNLLSCWSRFQSSVSTTVLQSSLLNDGDEVLLVLRVHHKYLTLSTLLLSGSTYTNHRVSH